MAKLLERIKQLPPWVQDLLTAEDVPQLNARIFERHGVPSDAEGNVLRAIQSVYLNDQPVARLLPLLTQALGDWNSDRLRALARDCIGFRLLPMRGWIAGVQEEIERLGGTTTDFPVSHERTSGVSVEDIARGANAAAGVTLDDRQVRRFQDAVESFVRSVRTRDQVWDVLTRSVKVGGVGLTEGAADAAIEWLQQRIAADDGTPLIVSRSTPPDALSPTPDEERLLDHTARPSAHGSAVDAAVERVIRITGVRFEKEETAQRFRAALASRFRDVRDAQETRDILLRPFAQGGMGLPAEHVRKLSLVIEREAGEVLGITRRMAHGSETDGARITDTRRTPPKMQTQPAQTTPIVRQSRVESQESREASQQATANSKQSAEQHRARDLPIVDSRPPMPHPLPPPLAPKPVAPPPPPAVIPPPPPPVPRPALVMPPQSPPEHRLGAPSPLIGGDLTPAIRRGVEVAATPAVSPPSVVPVERVPASVIREHPSPIRASSVLSAKPKIQDIRPPRPRLVGPIEELEQLTIDDFRKIAKTPADAAAKIAEKLTLLDRRSHTERAQGVKALRGSPLMVAYADILNTALAGGTTADNVIAASGTLSKEEFEAVMGLTTQLRV